MLRNKIYLITIYCMISLPWKCSAENNSSLANVSVIAHDIFEWLKMFGIVDMSSFIQFDTELNDTRCNEDIQEIVQKSLTDLWAFNFIDATAKYPNGKALGPHLWLGSYDECLEIKHPDDKFVGQYCLIRSNITKLKEKMVPLPFVPMLGMLFVGICVPSTCPYPYVERAIQSIRLPLLNNTAFKNVGTFVIKPEDCHVLNEQRIFEWQDWAAISILGLIILLTLTSTIYECYQHHKVQNDDLNKWLSSFSTLRNIKALLKVEKDPSEIRALHGLRAISMAWVIFGYLSVTLLYGNTINGAAYPHQLKEKTFMFYNNAHQAFDTFFVLSSLLLVITFRKEVSKTGSYDVPLAMIKRYLRMTPTFAFLILTQMTLMAYAGTGPVYNLFFNMGKQICVKNWPAALLYFQNYLPSDQLCLYHTWFLAADMQLFWISPIFLYPAIWWPKLATAIAFVMAWTVASLEFYIAYVNDLGPTILFSPHNTSVNQLEVDHYPTHTRAAPWFVGLVLGFVIVKCRAKGKLFKLSKAYVIICWLVFSVLFLIFFFGILAFEDDYSQPWSALFLSYRRIGWSAGVAWIIFACDQGYGECYDDVNSKFKIKKITCIYPIKNKFIEFLLFNFSEGFVNSILSWRPLTFFSKISYNMYLIHLFIIHYKLAQARDLQYNSIEHTVFDFIPIYCVSTLMAVLMTLLIEYPCSTLSSLVFNKAKILPLPCPRAKEEFNAVERKSSEKSTLPTEWVSAQTTVQEIIETNTNSVNINEEKAAVEALNGGVDNGKVVTDQTSSSTKEQINRPITLVDAQKQDNNEEILQYMGENKLVLSVDLKDRIQEINNLKMSENVFQKNYAGSTSFSEKLNGNEIAKETIQPTSVKISTNQYEKTTITVDEGGVTRVNIKIEPN